jgi:hypothetical protein
MKVLYIPDLIAEQINGYQNGAYIFEASRDGGGKYYAPLEVKTYEPWRDIWPIFQILQEIDYTPLPDPEEE